MKKLLTFNNLTLTAVTIVLCCTVLTKAAISKSGTFNLDGTSDPCFNPIPFTGSSMYVYPFAAPDTDLYTGAGSNYNLGTLQLISGLVSFYDSGERTGDMGIRIYSGTAGNQTFNGTILTLDLGDDFFNVFLPEFTIDSNQEMFFWVAQSGATYYATASQGAGRPDMTANDAIAADNLAMVPEPVTLSLFGSGALILLRRRRR